MKKVKFSGYYCFYMNTNILGDFQICIIASLKQIYSAIRKCNEFRISTLSVFFDRMLKIYRVKLEGVMVGRW